MRAIVLVALLCPFVRADDEDKALKAKATELAKQMSSKDLAERLTAVREAAKLHHRSLVAPLVKLLKDKDERIRLEAIVVLGMRDDPKDKRSAAKALIARLKPLEGNEKTRPELLKVIEALHDLAQTCGIKPLLDMKSDTERSVAAARARAVANVPSKEAIERLIQFGYKDRRGSARTTKTATVALAYATQTKVRGGIEQWRKWWSDNKATFDVELAAEQRAKTRADAKAKEEKREANRNKKKKRKKKNEEGS